MARVTTSYSNSETILLIPTLKLIFLFQPFIHTSYSYHEPILLILTLKPLFLFQPWNHSNYSNPKTILLIPTLKLFFLSFLPWNHSSHSNPETILIIPTLKHSNTFHAQRIESFSQNRFFNPYIFATQCRRTMNSVRSNNLSLKYLRF